MIKKPEELNFRDKKFAMIIAGYPGIGKTTLALSAPKPLLVDLDNKGIGRVMKKHRKDVLFPINYDDLISTINNEIDEYETLIIDTGGKLLDFLKPVVIEENASNGKKDGSLSLSGYGAVARKFSNFTRLCLSADKNVIYIFHSKEEKDGDATKLRIAIEGSSKDNVWQEIDFGGFMEMNGKDITIGFTNCERYFAKGIFGIKGTYKIPDVSGDRPNDFLTKLFELARKNADEESADDKLFYNKAMKLKAEILNCETVDEINKCIEAIKLTEHALTSEKELKYALNDKAISLNLHYDKELNEYVPN